MSVPWVFGHRTHESMDWGARERVPCWFPGPRAKEDNSLLANPLERSRPRDHGALRRDRPARPKRCAGLPSKVEERRRRIPKMVARPRPLQGCRLQKGDRVAVRVAPGRAAGVPPFRQITYGTDMRPPHASPVWPSPTGQSCGDSPAILQLDHYLPLGKYIQYFLTFSGVMRAKRVPNASSRSLAGGFS